MFFQAYKELIFFILSPIWLICYLMRFKFLLQLCDAGPVASWIADPGVMSLISARPNTFVAIDCEILSKFVLLLLLFQEGLLSVRSKSMSTEYWLAVLCKLAQRKRG